MRRYFTLALVLAFAVVPLAAIPASAAPAFVGLDLTDYPSTQTVNGDTVETVYNLPLSYGSYAIASGGNYISHHTGLPWTTSVSSGYTTWLFNPLSPNYMSYHSSAFSDAHPIDLSAVPLGSSIAFQLSFTLSSAFAQSSYCDYSLWALDANGQLVKRDNSFKFTNQSGGTTSWLFVSDTYVHDNPDVRYLIFGFRWNVRYSSSTSVTLRGYDDSDFRMFVQTPKSVYDDFVASGGSGAIQDSDQFNSEVGDKTDELDDLVDQMGQVTKPAVDDIPVDIDDIVSPQDVKRYTNVFQFVFRSDMVVGLLSIVAIFMFASFVLFGKKG